MPTTNSSITPSSFSNVETVSALSFGLILLSSIIHASWNLASRATKGDFATLVGGVCIAAVIIIPFAVISPISRPIVDGVFFVVASGIVHVAYIALVGGMYSVGNISLVYPVARGTGVALTAILAGPILGETVSLIGGFGIALVICGIVTMAWSKLGMLGKCATYDILGRHSKDKEQTKDDATKDDATKDDATKDAKVNNKSIQISVTPTPPTTSPGLTQCVTRCHSKAPSLALALLCGTTIATYSLLDKAGVGKMNPIQYSAGMLWVETLFMMPYMFIFRRNQCFAALRERKKYMVIVGVGGWGCYLIVLYVLTSSPSSYVTALREVSVVFGALLGVVVLKEKLTLGIVIGVVAIVVGLTLIKMA
jgi:uncharacterized membrane protein